MKILILIIAILGSSLRLAAATVEELEAQINALLATIAVKSQQAEEYKTRIQTLEGTISCLNANLLILVGEERMKQIVGDCLQQQTNTASGLTVTHSPIQPTDTLAPLGAARIPFTRITFTASPDNSVVVDGLIVMRDGLSVDTVLDSVGLLDEDGLIIGSPKTLNSNHQAALTGKFVVKAGSSRTLTIGGNRPTASTSAHAGMIVGLSLVKVSTQTTVAGSFPITGAYHTVNEGLAIGSVATMRGSTDPGQNATKYIGTTGYAFSSIRIVAGSAEEVRLKAIRWNQTGTAVPADLANVTSSVGAVPYKTVINADGKYYTTTFGNGIVIDKGFSKEIVIRADILNGVGRTVDFDIEARRDMYLVGENYGFGIIPPLGASATPPDSAAFSNADNPWYDAAEVTITAGDITVSASSLVPDQNIAINTANQPLGGFTADVQGEPISMGFIGFNVKLENAGVFTDVDDLTNITLMDENGAVIAGPVDGMAVDAWQTTGFADGSIVFTDTVVFPVGTHSYLVSGKAGVDFANNATLRLSTMPSTDFGMARGLSTGGFITPVPASSIAMSTMTIKRGTLLISSVASTDKAVMAGARQVVVAQIKLDATQSGEDIWITHLPLVLTGWKGDFRATDLTNCQLYDGITSVTSGWNAVNPTITGEKVTFTFDGTGIIIPKGTAKTLPLRVNIASSAVSSSFSFDVVDFSATYTGATGLASAQTVQEVFAPAKGGINSIVQHGELVAQFDTSLDTIVGPDTDEASVKVRLLADMEAFQLREMTFSITAEGGATPFAIPATTHNGDETLGVLINGEFTLAFPDAFVAADGFVVLKIPRTSAKSITITLKRVLAIGSDSGANVTSMPDISHTVRFLSAPSFSKFFVFSGVGGLAAHFEIDGLAPKYLYNIEGTTDLKNWQAWRTITSDTDQYKADLPLSDEPMKFFRLKKF